MANVYIIFIALLAALLAVGAAAIAGIAKLPGWLVRIIEFTVLLVSFVWLQTVF